MHNIHNILKDILCNIHILNDCVVESIVPFSILVTFYLFLSVGIGYGRTIVILETQHEQMNEFSELGLSAIVSSPCTVPLWQSIQAMP